MKINYMYELLNALSPEKWLKRGFSLISDESGNSIYCVKSIMEKSLEKNIFSSCFLI